VPPLVLSGQPSKGYMSSLWSHGKAVGSITELACPLSDLEQDLPSPTEL